MRTLNKSDINRLVLGTAQLGSKYGIMNNNQRFSKKMSFSILEEAWNHGVRFFDTAPGYQSEELIGEFVKTHGISKEINIITKISSVDSSDLAIFIEKSTENSIKKLNANIFTLFLHDPSDSNLLINNQSVFKSLKTNFNVKEIGASVYDICSVNDLRKSNLSLAFQFPLNFLDRRFEGVDICKGKRFARSIFLQGLLSSNSIPKKSLPASLLSILNDYHNLARVNNLDSYGLALSFAILNKNIDYVLFGVDNMEQLNQLFTTELVERNVIKKLNFHLEERDLRYLDPRIWTIN